MSRIPRTRSKRNSGTPGAGYSAAPSEDHPDIQVKVVDKDYPEVRDVDGKLILLAREFDAHVLTTDFNLNKVASLQGVTVLNVNDLANALKPAVLPGDSMVIFIAKEGKEKEQGVGYLDDGTMVVSGRRPPHGREKSGCGR